MRLRSSRCENLRAPDSAGPHARSGLRYPDRLAGPGFTITDLIQIAVFAANFAVVAPVSVVAVAVVLVRRRGPPTWLVPIAIVNVVVVLPQIAVPGAMPETWLVVLLVVQLGAAISVLVWWARARASSRAEVA